MSGLDHFRAIVPIYDFMLVNCMDLPKAVSVSMVNGKRYHATQDGKLFKQKHIMHDMSLADNCILTGIARTDDHTYVSLFRSSVFEVYMYTNKPNILTNKLLIKRSASSSGLVTLQDSCVYIVAEGTIWKVGDRQTIIASGFVCPKSFTIFNNYAWVCDDIGTYARIYCFEMGVGIDVTVIKPVFEYPYVDGLGSGIIGGFYYKKYFFYADQEGYLGMIEFRDNKYIQVAHKRIVEKINSISFLDNIIICTPVGVLSYTLKTKVRSC